MVGPLRVGNTGPAGQRRAAIPACDPQCIQASVGGRGVRLGEMLSARGQIGIHASEITQAMQLLGPGGDVGQHRCAAGRIAGGVVLHVAVDRAARQHAQRLGLQHRVRCVGGPQGRGGDTRELGRVRPASAGCLVTDVDRNDPPALERRRRHPARGEVWLGAASADSADVHADALVGRGDLPRLHRREWRRRAGVEGVPGQPGRGCAGRIRQGGGRLGRCGRDCPHCKGCCQHGRRDTSTH